MTAVRVGGMTPMGSCSGEPYDKHNQSSRCNRWNRRTGFQSYSFDPALSWVLGLFALFSNVFGWDNIPLLGELVPLIGNLGGSGIWYYLIGLLIGIGAIVASLLAEVIVD